MSPMREMRIVLGLIKQQDDYLLQLREGDPKKGAVNMIGCYGGKIEQGEKSLDAMQRELGEETTLKLPKDALKYLGSVDVVSDHNLEPVHIFGEVFLTHIGEAHVESKEGSLVRLSKFQVGQRLDEMTPGTRAVFEQFVLNQEV